MFDISNNAISSQINVNRFDAINEITRTLASELEHQLQLPNNSDISSANLELSITLIDDFSRNSLL